MRSPSRLPLTAACVCLLLAIPGSLAAQGSGLVGKKLIRIASETNSQLFTTTLGAPSLAASDLSTAVAAWQDAGLDGLCITIASNDPGKGFTNMGAQWWNVAVQRDYAEFTGEIAALNAVANWGRLTTNFLHSSMGPWDTPGGVTNQNWFDDQHWQTLTDNVALQARIASEAGFAGVLLDTEQYNHHGAEPWYHPFDYARYAAVGYQHAGEPSPRPLAEVQAKVFQRGQEYAQALNSEFPGITLWMIPAIYRPPNGDLLPDETLYQSFFDGILSGLDASSKLVAGSENTYELSDLDSFETIRDETFVQYQDRSSYDQELQDKWSYATGVYADAPPGWSDTDVTQNLRTPAEHEVAVRNALATSDHYAWLYGEQSFFLTTSPTPLMQQYLQANEDAHFPRTVRPFSDTFDLSGGGPNPTGGVSELAGSGHFYSAAREAVVFDYRLSGTEQEYRGTLDAPPAATDPYTAEVVWTVDAGSFLFENAALLNGIGFLFGEQRALIRLEAKEDPGGDASKWVIEVAEDGTGANLGIIPGLVLPKGDQTTITAHNRGDGAVDLFVNGSFIASYTAGPGNLEWLGNLGNNSIGLGFSSAALHSVSVTLLADVPSLRPLGMALVCALLSLAALRSLRR